MNQAFEADKFGLPKQLVKLIIPDSDAPAEPQAEAAMMIEEDAAADLGTASPSPGSVLPPRPL